LDAGKVDKALAILLPLQNGVPRAEATLRLGYAQLLKGDLDGAQKSLEKAYASAKVASEWRTRARAKFDLGRIALRRGKKDEAKERVAEAFAEGLLAKPGATGEEAELYAMAPAKVAPRATK